MPTRTTSGRLGRLAVCLAAGTLGLSLAAIPLASAAGAASSPTTVLKTDLLPGLSLLKPAAANPNKILHIGVGLSQTSRQSAAEDAYQAAVYNPASSAYHHFLTPSQFDARFGVAPSRVRAVQRWLISGGLQVDETAGAGNWIQASGTVAKIDSLMHVKIASYRSKGVSFLANESAPTVPAGDSIETVVGLNTLQRFSVPASKKGLPAGAPAAPSGCAPSCEYTPQQMWSLYDMPAKVGGKTLTEGQGMTMGVFGEGQSNDVISNLRLFEKAMHLPEVPVTVHDVGKGPFSDDSGQIEWDLDTQASTGMAPKVRGIQLFFASSLLDADVETEFASWVSDPTGPETMNASFGECETDPANALWNAEPPAAGQFAGDGDNLEPVAEKTLEQATIEGRTLFAAAGDTGSSCPFAALPVIGAGNGVVNQGQPMLNYPCASDYAVCVGGTVLYSNGAKQPKRSLEYAWPYSGGGSAAFIAETPWQKKVSAIDHPCLVKPSGASYPSGTVCRGAPDVAAMSGDIATNGYDIYESGSASTEGGTSLSSPLWVGMWTRIQSAARKPLGFADPTIYKVGESAAKYAKSFFDVTLGTNGLYQAGSGWDYVSGWGVPKVAGLMSAVDGKVTATHNIGPGKVAGPARLACPLLWKDSPHTATDVLGNNDPQLSLENGVMAATSKELQVKLTIFNLTKTVPEGASAADWYMTWTVKKKTYFAQAQLSAVPNSSFTFADGTIATTNGERQYSTAHTDTGKVKTGKNGSITVNVPLGNVGLKKGELLSGPTGATFTEEGIPPNPSSLSGGFLESVDSGGPTKNYVVGSTCKKAKKTSKPKSTKKAKKTSKPKSAKTSAGKGYVVSNLSKSGKAEVLNALRHEKNGRLDLRGLSSKGKGHYVVSHLTKSYKSQILRAER